jgi:tRNA (cmo5U34)-methyltransferase
MSKSRSSANGRKVDETISAIPGKWEFNAEVSAAFDSHVRKSVPFYDELQRMVTELSEYFVRNRSVVYDLGSSTGETLGRLAEKHSEKDDVEFIGFDLSESMVVEARKKLQRPNVNFFHKNILDAEFSATANLVTSLFTLQFLTLSERRELLLRVNQALVEGGGLIIVEKVRAENSFFEDLWIQLYWDFKRRQGLTADQILDKAHSIRGVLNPLSIEENLDLLHKTGFSRVEVFFKWYNWAGFLAVKNHCLAQPHGVYSVRTAAAASRTSESSAIGARSPAAEDL